VHGFVSIDGVRIKIKTWRRDDNACRPHHALDGLSPEMYLDAPPSRANQTAPILSFCQVELRGGSQGRHDGRHTMGRI